MEEEKKTGDYRTGIEEKRVFRTIGLKEERIKNSLSDIVKWGKAVSIETISNLFGVDIKVIVSSEKEGVVPSLIKSIESSIKKRFGDNIYGVENESLEEIVMYLFSLRKKTLAVAESCTGGLISHLLTSIPGSSEYYKGGIVAYSNEAKIDILGLPEGIIRRCGAVSADTAKEMAIGVARALKADVGLSVTGIAGPGGGTEEKPVGLVYMGVASEGKPEAKRFFFLGTREDIKEQSAYFALDMARRKVL
ncbi:MAG: nicotinamide-nucleotide amidohydrolase family protein [bacterium]|nr:nicotinamide-nucleotide amidohydrolase family protein [bacterium]